MIRLQKNNNPVGSANDDILDSNDELNLENPSDELNAFETPLDSNEMESSKPSNLNSFAKNVLSKLIEKDIPPLPNNYQIYFEQMLDREDLDLQKKIHLLLEAESNNDDRNIDFEKNINFVFVNTKQILKCTLAIYKNLSLINDIEKKWCMKLNRQDHQNDEHLKQIEDLQNQVDIQNRELKLLYSKGNQILENIYANAMYDSKFDVYNKRYFIKLVQEEIKAVQKFQHTSTIFMMTLPERIMQYLTSDKTALVVMKTFCKLLLKTSRRSDLIGYIGNGIFGMLLKHSDISSARKASDRLAELLHNTNIFIGDNDINLDIKIGIAKAVQNRNAETSINYAISALREAQKSEFSYIIYKEDAE